jgi:hypothetical protein
MLGVLLVAQAPRTAQPAMGQGNDLEERVRQLEIRVAALEAQAYVGQGGGQGGVGPGTVPLPTPEVVDVIFTGQVTAQNPRGRTFPLAEGGAAFSGVVEVCATPQGSGSGGNQLQVSFDTGYSLSFASQGCQRMNLSNARTGNLLSTAGAWEVEVKRVG